MTGSACMWEVSARKAGNVHPHRAFSDLNIDDFLNSALAIAPLFADAVVHTNTNLGIVLLLAPLAVGRRDRPLGQAVVEVLENLTVEDSRQVYEAIRLAQPGGMGQVAEEDVHRAPTLPLRQVMALAQKRDLIACQYVNGFQEVLHEGLPALLHGLNEWGNLEDAIVGTHLELLAHHPDSLIVRKCGIAMAEDASRRAQGVLNAGWPLSEAGQQAFAAFDAWLCEDGNRRNPGTSADLVTACIFAALRDNEIGLPLSVPWSRS